MFIFSLFGSDRSPIWRKVRAEHIKQQPQCQACGSKKSLEVHHIEPVHVKPERELDKLNLITLCKTCHFVFGHLMDYKSWNINVASDAETHLNKVMRRPYNEKLSGNTNNNDSLIYRIIRWYKRSINSR